MIAGAAHSPLDYGGAFTLWARDLWGWCIHGGSWDCGKSLGEVEQSYGQLWGSLGSVMRYLGKRRVGLCPHLGLPRNNFCSARLGASWVLMRATGVSLWLELPCIHAGFEKRDQPLLAQYQKMQSIQRRAKDWFDDLGERSTEPLQRI